MSEENAEHKSIVAKQKRAMDIVYPNRWNVQVENMLAPADPAPPLPQPTPELEAKIKQLLDGDPIGEKTAID